MKRSFRAVGLAASALLLLGPIPNSLARSTNPRVPAGRNVATPQVIENVEVGSAAGYATGTVVHADVLRAGRNAVVNLDVAFSGAAFAQKPAPAPYENEVQRLVANLDTKRALGRGTGLELGLLADPEPLIGELSKAEAPVSTELITNRVGPIEVPNIVFAELLKSAARARATETGCPMGKDAGYGLGSVLNLEVLGGLLATNAKPPYREVAQSSSTTRIVKTVVGEDTVLGLKSESRQTIAPVTFFKGLPFQFTVEVLGEWALRAMAFGTAAAPSVHYGPLDMSPETPVVRILDSTGKPIFQVTTQMLLGPKGLELVIPEIAEIVIGEDPRMVGDNAGSDPLIEATKVAAAADVVRVRLLKGQLADVRVGHMEAAVAVPAGGVECPGLIVDETVEPPTVTTGDEFTYEIDITNPNDCVVTGLKLAATTTLPEGVTIELVSTSPSGGTPTGTTVSFSDLGTLGPGETKTIKITSKVPLGSAEGLITSTAVAEGVCPVEVAPPADTDGTETPGTPETGTDIPVRGEDSVEGPTVDTCIVPDVEGLPYAEAVKLITDAGCVVGDVTKDPDAEPGDEGEVTNQSEEPGTSVPRGTEIDLAVGGELCTVPSVVGKTVEEAVTLLTDAGCILGDTNRIEGDDSGPPGTIDFQDIPPGDVVPAGTKVNVGLVPEADTNLIAADTGCNVPGLIGMTEADARTNVEKAGCVLVVEPKNTSDPNELGKVLTQNPGAGAVVPRGSTVTVGIGVQVLGNTLTAGQEAAATPNLARTGGLFLGGLSLWLLVAGLAVRGAGSKRLWSLARRRND